MTGGTPSALGCASGDGAIVLAINKRSGEVVWRTKAETHLQRRSPDRSAGTTTRSSCRSETGGRLGQAYPNIYVEPIDPASHYPCCSARGSLVAMDVIQGRSAGSDIPTSARTPIMSWRRR